MPRFGGAFLEGNKMTRSEFVKSKIAGCYRSESGKYVITIGVYNMTPHKTFTTAKDANDFMVKYNSNPNNFKEIK